MKLSAIGAVLFVLASLGFAMGLAGCSCDTTDPNQQCLAQ